MSDQPKPSGEWTARTVFDMIAKDSNAEWNVADAHNSALAAEKEKHNKDLREYESALSDTHLSRIKVLEQQLAAERETRRKEMETVTMNTSDIETVADEREKVQTYEGALIKIANDPNCDRCQVAVDALAKVVK